MLALFVVPVAIIGGFFVYRSYAWSSTFMNTAKDNEISGGVRVDKGGGVVYMEAKNTQYGAPHLYTYASKSSLTISNDVCVHYHSAPAGATVGLQVYNVVNSKKTTVSGAGELCITPSLFDRYSSPNNTDLITITATVKIGEALQVDNVYGKF